MQVNRAFPTAYWGEDKATSVVFIPFSDLPAEPVTACMVAAVTENLELAIARPERGWGLPGGHREGDETAEECVRHEALEEAGITLKNIRLIGGWRVTRVKYTEQTARYPEHGYQLLYAAQIASVNKNHPPRLEILESKLIPITEFPQYHHNFDSHQLIYEYFLEEIQEYGSSHA